MKKKLMECPIHGLTLHRCKRKIWHTSSGKEDKHPDSYTEKCFKCISEGRHKKRQIIPRAERHISF